jgi:hypothetical protein
MRDFAIFCQLLLSQCLVIGKACRRTLFRHLVQVDGDAQSIEDGQQKSVDGIKCQEVARVHECLS